MVLPIPASLLLLCVTCQGLAAQDPEVLATYRLRDRTLTLSRTDVAIEMAFHLRRRPRGREACEQLANTALTRAAAEQQNLMPSATEVAAFWTKLQEQLRAAGQRPESFAWVRNCTAAERDEQLAVQLAQSRLVRTELGLGPDETVSGSMLKLWLQEQKKRVTVLTDPDQLPAGTAARVGSRDLPMIDLGLLLLRTAEDSERTEFMQQAVLLATVEAEAKQRSLTVSDADLDLALQKRAEEAKADPRYRGANLDAILQAEGLSVAALRELRVFRAHILLEKLARVRFPTPELERQLASDRNAVLELVGPRRRLGIIFLNAMDPPNDLVRRDFDSALRELENARARIGKTDKDTFEHVARTTSEHAQSKQQGGDIGWHRRRSEALPEPVLAAAFALPPDQVSMPIRGDTGGFLVKLLEVEPVPEDGELVERLRAYRTRELREQLLVAADLQPTPPTAGR
jgi:parvulin-like peptidyl-prolyl isomerase